MVDDDRVMKQFQQGSDAAYEELVRRWENPMLNFFYRSVGDFDTAQDLRQDLFIRLYQYRGSFNSNGSFRAWLYSIATNLLRTHYRKVRPAVSIDDPEDGAHESASLPGNGEPATAVVHRQELARLARRMLDSLPAEDREALVLRFYQRLQYNEIAEALGVPEPTVKSRVYRALERLRQQAAAKGLTAADLF